MYSSNGFKLTKENNRSRIAGVSISFFCIILIIIRYTLKRDFKYLKYILSIRLNYPKYSLEFGKMFLEIIVMLFQPLPYISYSKKKSICGIVIDVNLDMFLSLLSFIKLYSFIRLFRLMSDHRRRRVWKFFKNKHIYGYLYKSVLKDYGIIALILLSIVSFFIFSQSYVVIENVQNRNENFFNALWLVMQSYSGAGYGDFKPESLFSQVLFIFIIAIGKYFYVTLEMQLMNFITIFKEKEIKAYNKIKEINHKESQTNGYNIYFQHFLKYKMKRVKEQIKKNYSTMTGITNITSSQLPGGRERNVMIKNHSYFQAFSYKMKLKLVKEKYYLGVISTIKNDITLSDLVDYVKNDWELQMNELIEKYVTFFSIVYSYQNYLIENLSKYNDTINNVHYLTNQVTNFVCFIYWCGPLFPVDSYESLYKFRVAQHQDFLMKLKEFILLFKDRKRYLRGRLPRKISKDSVEGDWYFPDVSDQDLLGEEDFESDDDDFIKEDSSEGQRSFM